MPKPPARKPSVLFRTALPIASVRWGWCALMVSQVGWAWAQAQTPSCPDGGAGSTARSEALTHKYALRGQSKDFSYSASATMVWRAPSPQRYELSYTVKAFVFLQREQLSEGLWSARGLIPTRFVEIARRTRVTTADPEQKRVQFPERSHDSPWVAGSQDKLSVWAQLGGWIACRPMDFKKDAQVQVPVWGSGETEVWTFGSNGVVQLSTPYGDQQAIHMTRPAGQGGDSHIDLWFVPQWGVLPVRIRVRQANGDLADQQLSERQPRP